MKYAYSRRRARLQGYKTEARLNPALESHPTKGWAPTSAHPRGGVIIEGELGLARAGVQRHKESSNGDYTRRRLDRHAGRVARRRSSEITTTSERKRQGWHGPSMATGSASEALGSRRTGLDP